MQKILSKYPLEIITPENVIAKIGKDFKVLRSDGKMDSGWIVEKCLKLVPHHQHEDEFMVTVVKRVKGQAPLTKTISLGNLKIWNDQIDIRPKEMMSASALSRYLGKTSFNVLRSSGKVETCWMIQTCLRFSEQDNEDDFIVLLVKVDSSRAYERKAISLRALKTWNGIQPFSRAKERSPAYIQKINNFIANDPYL